MISVRRRSLKRTRPLHYQPLPQCDWQTAHIRRRKRSIHSQVIDQQLQPRGAVIVIDTQLVSER